MPLVALVAPESTRRFRNGVRGSLPFGEESLWMDGCSGIAAGSIAGDGWAGAGTAGTALRTGPVSGLGVALPAAGVTAGRGGGVAMMPRIASRSVATGSAAGVLVMASAISTNSATRKYRSAALYRSVRTS